MDITSSVDEVIRVLARASRSDVMKASDEPFRVAPRWLDSPISVEESSIKSVLDSLRSRTEVEETTIVDSTHYEILVREEFAGLVPPISGRTRAGEIVKEDAENGLVYRLSRPSDKYLVFIVLKLLGPGPERRQERQFRDVFQHPIGVNFEKEVYSSIFDLLRRTTRRLTTLQIESKRQFRVTDFVKHANSFLFQLSFNLDIAFIPLRSLDELARRSRISGMRRSDPGELEAPRRFYNPDLIYRYQQGVASDSALLQYLSYYHVAEHFFAAVFDDDLVEGVRSNLTHPGFSYRRKRDIQDLIKTVSRAVRTRGEEMSFDELYALRLTLQRYLDLEDLRSSLTAFDQTLIPYYATHEVQFSNGDLVDLSADDGPGIITSLSRRIYKTRNAIVHSKEGTKGRYTPFQHDKMLLREVPLVRFIAEQIIIGSSTLINPS